MTYRPTPTHLFGYRPSARPERPHTIWRTLCWATPSLAVSGDLPGKATEARSMLATWVASGVTDIVDLRIEDSHEQFVGTHAPHVKYHWLGVDDEGDRRSDEWFEAIAEVAAEILSDPTRKLVVHCHMGANRGPSAAFTALLVNGMSPTDALTAIRTARPIASMLYSFDAVQWFGRSTGLDQASIDALFDEVYDWHVANPLDLGWVISNIGNRYAA